MIETYKGITILNAGENPEDHIRAILKFKNADRIEQLTYSEIKEVNNMLEEFKDAILSPLDVSKIDFSFHLELNGELREVYIGKISRYDMTLTTLMQFEELHVGKWEAIPYLVACVYAPMVEAMFGIKRMPGMIVQKITNVFMGMDFRTIYGLYAFFLSYKIAYLKNSNLSIQRFAKCYQRNLKRLKRHQGIIRSSKKPLSQRKSKLCYRSMTKLHSLKNMLGGIVILCIARVMVLFMRYTTKPRANTSKDD